MISSITDSTVKAALAAIISASATTAAKLYREYIKIIYYRNILVHFASPLGTDKIKMELLSR